MKPALTIIIPTLNEEDYVAHAIQSALFADEIIVIDSYSTDNTLQIAEKYHCRILQRTFDDFSSQKNHALAFAKNKWVFILDADEYINPVLRAEIIQVIKQDRYYAYEVPRLNFFMNRFLRYGSNGSDRIARMLYKDYCHYKGLVHEQLHHKGKMGKLKNLLYHYTYRSLSQFKSKKDKYSTLQAQQKKEIGAKVNTFHLVIKPAFRFYKEFLIRLGFLDGLPGLTTTRMNCYGVFSRYVKLRTLNGENKDTRLIDYDVFSDLLTAEAEQEAIAARIYSTLLPFLLLPKLTFLNQYFIKGNFIKGQEGYAISYLYSFKTYQKMTFSWLKRRNLE